MLDETPSSTAAPTFWAVINSWFTSTVFFLVLQLVIGTIYITSNIASNQKQEQDSQGNNDDTTTQELPRPRSPSRLTYTSHENPLHQVQTAHARSPSTRKEEIDALERHHLEEDTEEIDDEEKEEKSLDEVYSQIILEGQLRHFRRSRSDTELPVKVGGKMKKSALSDNLVSGADDGVDAKADDFINKFKKQLKLQRLDSITT
ncbi:hypothetical protein PIB30_043103 [Stylosanthes scabra]|uniref:DUF4408 domain-containing protein n=1 Tax=Stylosanthes scabra TaxID=79078 RepID=A0ABU6UEQ8_9FABA|nr:hypothetical protein [Stylosanthes scabra]